MTIPAVLEIGTDRLFRQRPSVCAVYAYLVGQLDLDEYKIVKAQAVARLLHMDKDTAGLALRTLCAHGYLLRKPFDGRTSTYKLVYRRRSEIPPKSERSAG